MTRLDQSPSSYCGRFAPSPSGLLHLGSLVCALASYLDARANAGRWLVRMEDIDPPREQPGAAKAILTSLEQHGLQWDEPVMYQSARSEHYLQRLSELQARQLTYRCDCTRARLKGLQGRYDSHCRQRSPAPESPCAVRLNVDSALETIGANQAHSLALNMDDFVVHRKDGLFAYQLAVVCDDIAQGITHVVRGRDLEPMTAPQQLLFKVFGAAPPAYLHIPLITDKRGNKLSKQNHAAPIDHRFVIKNLVLSCQLLGLLNDTQTQRNLEASGTRAILAWASDAWRGHTLAASDQIAPQTLANDET